MTVDNFTSSMSDATLGAGDSASEAYLADGAEIQIAQVDPIPVEVGEAAPVVPAVTFPAEVISDAGNVVHLPEGVSIDSIAVEGPNLILVQPDGSRIVVLNAALNIPTFIIGDVEIAPDVLVAALEAAGIDVAAGPDGTFSVAGSGPDSASADLTVLPPSMGSAYDPVDLLPPTQLLFAALDDNELTPGDDRGPQFGDFLGGFGEGGFLRLLEAALDESNDGGRDLLAGTITGTDPVHDGETRSGQIALTAGTTAITSVYFVSPASAGFVAPVVQDAEGNLIALVWTMDAGMLKGSLPGEGGVAVILMQIAAPLPIAAGQTQPVTVKVTLLDAFPHSEANAADDVVISGIQIGAVDLNGHSASASFGVIIVDDVPEIDLGADGDAGQVPMLLDESVDDERYSVDVIGEALKPDNATDDDVAGVDYVPGDVTSILADAVAFGSQSTSSGILNQLFSKNWDYGADRGAVTDPLKFNFSLVLNGAGEAGGVKSSLVVTAHPQTGELKDLSAGERSVWLFMEGGIVVGRIGATEAEAKNGLIALTISIRDGADLDPVGLDQASLVVEQFLPLQHPYDLTHDEGVMLLLSGEGASLQVKLEGVIEDGDGDTAVDSAVVDLVAGNKSFLTLEDDGPDVDVSGNRPGYGEHGLKLAFDESIGKDWSDGNAHRDDVPGVAVAIPSISIDPSKAIGIASTGGSGVKVKDLFDISVDAGSDGLKQETHHYSLTLTNALGLPALLLGVKTTMVVTALPGSPLYGMSEAARTIYLFQQADGSIVGKVGQTLFSGSADDFVALRIRIDASDPNNPQLIVEQYLPVQHGDTGGHDEAAFLTFADARSTLGINLTVKVVDGDNDIDIDSHTVVIADKNGSAIKIEDDGPSVKVEGAKDGWKPVTLDKLVFDETIGKKWGDSNADGDKVAGVNKPSLLLAADAAKAIGILSTPASNSGTSLEELFKVTIDAGTDGLKSTTETYSFTLKDDRGREVAAGNGDGVATNLKVTALPGTDLASFGSGNLRIWLYHEADGTIVGRIGQATGADADDFVALRIRIDTSGPEPRLVVEQYLPIDHGRDGNDFDSSEILQFLDKDASLSIKLTVEVKDGDNDTDTDSHSVTLIGKDTSIIKIEDDGPSVTVEGAKDGWKPVMLNKLVLDESIGQDTADDNADSDDTAQQNVVVTRFLSQARAIGELNTKGPDGTSVSDLFKAVKDGGTDGLKNTIETFTFDLKDKDGKAVKAGSKGVETNLKVTALPGTDVANKSDAFRTVWLTQEADGSIVGRVGKTTGTSTDDYIALRISIEVDAGGEAHLVVQQFMPLDHGWDGNNPDSAALLKLIGNNASLGITMTVKVIDGDNDYAIDSHTVRIADRNGSPFKFEDDGPTAGETEQQTVLDDEAQANGLNAGPGDQTGANEKSVNGTLEFAAGTDGLRSIAVSESVAVTDENGASVSLAAIWVDGDGVGHERAVTVNWTQNGIGGKLVGTAADIGTVFELMINADGTYMFELLVPLAHPLAAGQGFAGGYEDLLNLGFRFTVTDGDNDKAEATLLIKVDDDSPEIVGVTPVAYGQNLVKNGSFENGHHLTGSNWDIFESIDHWTAGGNVPFEVQIGGAGGVAAQDGNAIIELDGDTQNNGQSGNGTPDANSTNATIQQVIEGTVAGQTYKLTFHYALRAQGEGNSGMEVWFGGVKVHTIADDVDLAPGEWQEITIFVTAPTNDAVLSFVGTGAQNEFGALLDNVSMHAISPILVHDETEAVQVSADPNAQNDALGSSLPAEILALFNAIISKGDDPHASEDYHAIGFARSGADNPAFAFTAAFGADGKHATAAVAYALQTVDGTDSGLKTTEGAAITLHNGADGVILGQLADGTVAFAIAIDPATGELFLAQYLSVQHGYAGNGSDGSHDELAVILNDAIKATVTITDGDGDGVTSEAVSIGHLVGFQDDGPRVTLDGQNALANGLFFDGFVANGDVWGIGSGVATGSAGGWRIEASETAGAANPELQKVASGYRGAVSPTGSLIVDLEASPGNIQITQEIAGLTEGDTYRLSFEIGEANGAESSSSALQVWWNGALVDTYHPNSGLMQTIVVDVVAGNGDNVLQFREVGTPGDNTGTFLANVKLSDVIIIDETPGVDADADDTSNTAVAVLFDGVDGGLDPYVEPQFAQGARSVVSPTIDFGSDGAAAGGGVVYSFSLANADGVDSGLTTTEGQPILLYIDGSGRVIGVYDGSGATGKVAFALHIEPATGIISVAQYVSLDHPDIASHDEGVYLASGSLGVTVTVTDGDGDTASASTDISGLVRFEDDGPAVLITTPAARDWTLDEDRLVADKPHLNGNDALDDQYLSSPNPHFEDSNDYADNEIAGKPLGIGWGADGPGSLSFVVSENAPIVPVLSIAGAASAQLSSGGVLLQYVITGPVGGVQTLTAYKGDPADDSKVFTLSLDPNGGSTGSFTFRLLEELDHAAGSGQDSLSITFPFVATDGDGDEVASEVVIRITDDVPYVPDGPKNLIDNGTFEGLSGGVTTSWGTQAQGLDGWTLSGSGAGNPQPGPVQIERKNDLYLNMSAPGNPFMIDMATSPGNIQLSQVVSGAESGQIYAISFYAGAPFPGTAMLEVWWGGSLVGTIQPTGQMLSYSFLVQGGGDNTLVLKEAGSGSEALPEPNQNEGYHGTYIANVEMYAVVAFVDEDGLPKGLKDSQIGDVDPDLTEVKAQLGIRWGSDNADENDAGGLQDGAKADDKTGDNADLGGRALYFTNANVVATGTATVDADGAVLTSRGQVVSFQLVQNGTKLIGFVAGGGEDGSDRLVFEVSLSDDKDGSFTFKLHDQLDHAPNTNENDITLRFSYTARDFDGDTSQGVFIVGVDDDMPSASSGAARSVDEGAMAAGTFDFVGGADGASLTHINGTAVMFNGDGWSNWIDLDSGEIRVKADGSYQFAARPDDSFVQGTTKVDGTFTVTDRDGDSSTESFEFNVTDDQDAVTVKLTATPSTGEDGGSIIYTASLVDGDGNAVVTNNVVTVTLANGETITIAANASSGTATTAVNRDDVYLEADSIANHITGVSEANASSVGAFENLGYDATPVSTTITDDSDHVTATLTAGEAVPVAGGLEITYTITLSGGPGAIGPKDGPLVFTLEDSTTVTVPVNDTTGHQTVFYPYGSISDAILENAIKSYTGGAEYEHLDPTGSTSVEVAQPLLIVGSEKDDTAGQTTDHAVPNPQGPVEGVVQGGNADDTLIGDPGAVTVVPGQSANVVLVLDSSGSMTSNISFGGSGSSIQRMQALKNGTNALIDQLANSGAENIRITVIDFDSGAVNLGTFNLIVNGVRQDSAVTNAKAAVNSMVADGNTNYEAAMQAAHSWITGNGGNNDLPNADINKVVFVSDGEPQAYINSNGSTATSGGASRAMQELLGTYPGGSGSGNGADNVNDVQNVLNTGYTIDAIGINVGTTALGYLSDVEDGVAGSSGGGSAQNVTSAEQLAAALAVLGGSTDLAAAGNDIINGGTGNDIIFGDVVNTDALATLLGVNLTAGSGWAVFQTLENRPNSESLDPAGDGADWTRADTMAYIRANHVALAVESGRAGGNDIINGGDGDDIIYGQEGDDVIDGGAGNDIISGGSGKDTLRGGVGNDTFLLANGEFVAGESIDGGSDNDTILLTNATTVNFSTGTIINVENLVGSAGGDNVTMTAGQLAGFTEVNLGDGTDTLNISSGNFTSANDDQLQGIENIVLQSASTLNLSNQTENFTITGSSGADSITGGAGNDTIIGAQNDTLINGGDGNDTLNVGANFTSSGNGQIVNIENVTVTASGVNLNLANQTEGFNITAHTGGGTITAGTGADTVNINAGTSSTTWTINLGSDTAADKIVFSHAGIGTGHNTVATVSNFNVAHDKIAVVVGGTNRTDGNFQTISTNPSGDTAIGAGVEVIHLRNTDFVASDTGDDTGNQSSDPRSAIANAIGSINAGTYTVIVYSGTGSSANAGIYSMSISNNVSNLATNTSGYTIEHIMTLNGVGYGNLSATNFASTADPIVLDLDGDGYAFSSLADGVAFDLDGDGQKDRIAWNSSGDGILAIDLNGNGVIDDGSELFTPWFNGGNFANGSAALASLDSNGDGVIDANDEAFADLLIWRDLNGDGVSDAGELASLADHGITSLSAGTSAASGEVDGQAIVGEGTFTREDGSTGSYVEVELDFAPGAGEEVAQGETFVGTDDDDILIGGSEDDILAGGLGNDTLTGGAGADVFLFAEHGAANVDTITDYVFGEGDAIDLDGLLSVFGGEAGVQVRQDGADAVVEIDTGAGGWSEVAVLQNFSGDTVKILFGGDDHEVQVTPVV